MATVNYEPIEITTRGDHGHLIKWENLGAGDEGQAVSLIGAMYRSVQVIGNFSGSARGNIQGSNDGTNWATLTDSHGNELRFTGTGLARIHELPLWIRPMVSAGDGSTDLSFFMLFRKETR